MSSRTLTLRRQGGRGVLCGSLILLPVRFVLIEKIDNGDVCHNPPVLIQYWYLLDIIADHSLQHIFHVVGQEGELRLSLHEVSRCFRDGYTYKVSTIHMRIMVREKDVPD